MWSERLQQFLSDYPPKPYRPPRTGAQYPEEELVALDDSQLTLLNDGPISASHHGVPPKATREGRNCHLWVVDERGLPSILERRDQTEPPYKHTNITGGGAASAGGELWFLTDDQVVISGGSGRYPPESPEHLERITELFATAGFDVTSLGWDAEVGQAQRFLLEDR